MLSSCKKDETSDQLNIDIKKIEDYLFDHSLDAQKHESGLYYIILQPGGNDKPTKNSSITVSYKGTLLNGEVFDENEFFTSYLSYLIEGWRLGIPMIGSGGKIKLFIPSTLGYGDKASGSIPANSVLIFDITLHYFSD